MKKFLCLLMVLMLIPMYAFATSSPSTRTMVHCVPEIPFEFAIETDGWEQALVRLDEEDVDDDGYILLEALYISLPKECEPIEWYLMISIEEKYEPFIIILDVETISEVTYTLTERGNFLTDLSAYEAGNYYIFFFIKSL